MLSISELENIFNRNQERYIREWFEFLSFQSVSTSEDHNQDCRNCALWLTEHLKKIGLDARVMNQTEHPVVFAEKPGAAGKPVALLYGHYDVQPVDPLKAWTNPPFQPTLKDGRVYARGAQDNKGQLFYMIKALETLIAANALNASVKVIIEGEEESGSKTISSGIQGWKDILKSDVLMVADTNMIDPSTPTIVMGLRGMAYLTATLYGPDHDLHSGVHGGTAPNPAQGLAALINSLYNKDGSVAVAGFYNAVQMPSDNERALANATPIDPQKYQSETGVLPVAGEKQFTPVERNGFRPTIDVNGIKSGYGGKGVKTIIPGKAMAKITARLVPDQDPEISLQQIIKHLEKNVPDGLKLSITEAGASGRGFRLNPQSPFTQKAASVLSELAGRKTAFLWEGASIPIIDALALVAGAEPLLVGFGLENDNIHAPNESFSVEQLKMGFLYSARMLGSL